MPPFFFMLLKEKKRNKFFSHNHHVKNKMNDADNNFTHFFTQVADNILNITNQDYYGFLRETHNQRSNTILAELNNYINSSLFSSLTDEQKQSCVDLKVRFSDWMVLKGYFTYQ